MCMWALTLSICTQWPVGPVDLKNYFFKTCNFGSTSHCNSRDANSAVIPLIYHDLLLCFLPVSHMADNVATGVVGESSAAIEATEGRIFLKQQQSISSYS